MPPAPPGNPRRTMVTATDEAPIDTRPTAATPMQRSTRRAGIALLVVILLAVVVLAVIAVL